MTPERAHAVARQCVAEGRSVPPAAAEVLLAELGRLDRIESEARELVEALDERRVVSVNIGPLRTILGP